MVGERSSKSFLDPVRGRCQGTFGVTSLKQEPGKDIPSGMDRRRVGSHRRFWRGERREHLVTGGDQRDGFARVGAGIGRHQRDGIPDVTSLLAHRHEGGPVGHHVAGVPGAGNVLPGCHHGDPRQRARGGHIE